MCTRTTYQSSLNENVTTRRGNHWRCLFTHRTMEQVKIVPLIILYVMILHQVEIGAKGVKLHADFTGYGLLRENLRPQPLVPHVEEAQYSYHVLKSLLGAETAIAVLNDLRRTSPDIKDIHRTLDVTLPPQSDHFKANHQRTDFELIRREKENLPAIQRRTAAPTVQPRTQEAISRSSANVRQGKFPSTADWRKSEPEWPETRLREKYDKGIRNRHLSLRNRHNSNKAEFRLHSVVKRSEFTKLTDESNVNGGDTISRRSMKRHFAGYRIGDVGPQSATMCPVLPVTTRTIINCTNGRKIGSKCFLHCAPGYIMSSKRKMRKCRVSKRRSKKNSRQGKDPYWSGRQSSFQCVPICKPLDRLQHGSYNCSIADVHGGKAYQCSAVCKSGFKIDGSEKRICTESGEWSGETTDCKLTGIRHAQKVRFKYEEHQTFPCGEVYSIASFEKDRTVYLVVAEKTQNLVKIYRWDHDGFVGTPCQTFPFPAPNTVEVLTAPDGTMWLMVAGADPATFYRLQPNGRFHRSHVTTAIPPPAADDGRQPDAVGFAKLRGEIYRCYGRNRRDTPVIVVHRMQERGTTVAHGHDFKRVMRKKFPGERVNQCSMYSEGSSLYTVATVNKPSGHGRIIIGYLTKNRMKIVDIVSGHDLWRVSDSVGFTVQGERYIAVSQAATEGKCLIYKRVWRNRGLVETE